MALRAGFAPDVDAWARGGLPAHPLGGIPHDSRKAPSTIGRGRPPRGEGSRRGRSGATRSQSESGRSYSEGRNGRQALTNLGGSGGQVEARLERDVPDRVQTSDGNSAFLRCVNTAFLPAAGRHREGRGGAGAGIGGWSRGRSCRGLRRHRGVASRDGPVGRPMRRSPSRSRRAARSLRLGSLAGPSTGSAAAQRRPGPAPESPGCLTRTGDLRMSTGAAGGPAVSPTVPRSTTELSRDGRATGRRTIRVATRD